MTKEGLAWCQLKCNYEVPHSTCSQVLRMLLEVRLTKAAMVTCLQLSRRLSGSDTTCWAAVYLHKSMLRDTLSMKRHRIQYHWIRHVCWVYCYASLQGVFPRIIHLKKSNGLTWFEKTRELDNHNFFAISFTHQNEETETDEYDEALTRSEAILWRVNLHVAHPHQIAPPLAK